MPQYKVEVTTGDLYWAGTLDNVYVTICGSKGQSKRTKLDNWGPDFNTSQVSWNHAACLHEKTDSPVQQIDRDFECPVIQKRTVTERFVFMVVSFFFYIYISFQTIYGISKLIFPSTTSFQTSTYNVDTLGYLGEVLLLKVEKESFMQLNDDWYCSKIEVTPPGEKAIVFPCYKWLSTGEPLELRGGRGVTQIL